MKSGTNIMSNIKTLLNRICVLNDGVYLNLNSLFKFSIHSNGRDLFFKTFRDTNVKKPCATDISSYTHFHLIAVILLNFWLLFFL